MSGEVFGLAGLFRAAGVGDLDLDSDFSDSDSDSDESCEACCASFSSPPSSAPAAFTSLLLPEELE